LKIASETIGERKFTIADGWSCVEINAEGSPVVVEGEPVRDEWEWNPDGSVGAEHLDVSSSQQELEEGEVAGEPTTTTTAPEPATTNTAVACGTVSVARWKDMPVTVEGSMLCAVGLSLIKRVMDQTGQHYRQLPDDGYEIAGYRCYTGTGLADCTTPNGEASVKAQYSRSEAQPAQPAPAATTPRMGSESQTGPLAYLAPAQRAELDKAGYPVLLPRQIPAGWLGKGITSPQVKVPSVYRLPFQRQPSRRAQREHRQSWLVDFSTDAQVVGRADTTGVDMWGGPEETCASEPQVARCDVFSINGIAIDEAEGNDDHGTYFWNSCGTGFAISRILGPAAAREAKRVIGSLVAVPNEHSDQGCV
jgi:hypothetical protein